MCRHLYNWSLAERIEAYKKEGKTLSAFDQNLKLSALKKEKPWFKGVHSQTLQNVHKRIEFAYKSFFRRVKEGKAKPGFPKFKKKGKWFSITYPQFKDKPVDNHIDIPKLGKVKVVYHRDIPDDAQVKTLTFRKHGDKWFLCFSLVLPHQPESKPLSSSKVVGLDLGLVNFIYASDGSTVKVPKHYRKAQKKLKKAQRKLSKAKKRSKEFFKWLRIVRNLNFKVACRREAFHHKVVDKLLSQYDIICIEDLNIAGMAQRPKPKIDPSDDKKYLPNGASAKSGLNKSIYDAGWGYFVQKLEYKALAQGKQIVKVAPHYTSQDCSKCAESGVQTRIEKSLSTRTHVCTECGYVAPRDLNAALNIKRLGMESLGLQANPSLVGTLWVPIP